MPRARQNPNRPGRRPALFWSLGAVLIMVVGTLVFVAASGGLPGLQGHTRNDGIGPAIKADEPIYAAYGKSPTCRSCHEEAYALWQNSHHARAERAIDPEIDSLAFESHFSKIRHGSQVDRVATTNGQFTIFTKGPDGKQQGFVPERVLAVNPLHQFLIPFPGGRYQASELAFDPNYPDWFNVYGDEDRQPGEWGHWTGRGMNWNSMCAACHNTRVRKNYDPKSDVYRTSMAERGVGCEACHGPMADHNAWQAKHPNQKGDPTVRKLERSQIFDTCASCHSRRAEFDGEFVPGDKYFDHYALSIPDESDLFYPDGQIRDEDFEVTAFMGSRMHASGVLCIDCHEPHGGKVRMAGNDLCMTCHAAPTPPAPKIDPATHSFHKPGTRGDLCTDCHMPQTVYMQRHPRHDHGFTIPDPVLTKEFGIPNACNRCHDDRDVDWAIEAVQKWYGPRMDRPTRTRNRILARAKAGDQAVAADLVNLMRSETNAFWRAVSANFMRRWPDNSSVTAALLGGAVDPHPLVRSMSIRSLEAAGLSGQPAVQTAFRKALDDPSRNVRIDAAWAMHAVVDTNSTAGKDLLAHMHHTSDQPGGALQKGVFHLDRGDLDAAIAQFQRALSWDTNSAPLHHAMAIALSMQGSSARAVESLKTACRLAPRDAEYRYKLGLALNECNRLSEALTALEEAVQLEPRFARAWYNLGLAYNASNKPEKAIESLMRAEALDTTSAQIPYARATILARQGRVPEARLAANRALEIQPGFMQAQELLQILPQ